MKRLNVFTGEFVTDVKEKEKKLKDLNNGIYIDRDNDIPKPLYDYLHLDEEYIGSGLYDFNFIVSDINNIYDEESKDNANEILKDILYNLNKGEIKDNFFIYLGENIRFNVLAYHIYKNAYIGGFTLAPVFFSSDYLKLNEDFELSNQVFNKDILIIYLLDNNRDTIDNMKSILVRRSLKRLKTFIFTDSPNNMFLNLQVLCNIDKDYRKDKAIPILIYEKQNLNIKEVYNNVFQKTLKNSINYLNKINNKKEVKEIDSKIISVIDKELKKDKGENKKKTKLKEQKENKQKQIENLFEDLSKEESIEAIETIEMGEIENTVTSENVLNKNKNNMGDLKEIQLDLIQDLDSLIL